MQQDEKSFYLPTLDGWRAISILMVIIYHAAWFKLGPETSAFDGKTWHLFKVGTYGVSIFFTISGYLITSRILAEYKKYGFFNLRDFYIKRFFRIFPPFYFYLFSIFIINYLIDLKISGWDFITSLCFLRIYHFESLDWYTAHIWSLCVEEHFYILLSLVFFVWGITKSRWVIAGSLVLVFIWNIMSFRYKDIPSIEILIKYLKVFSWMDYMFVGSLFAFLSNNFQKIRLSLIPFQPICIVLYFFLLFIDFHFKILIMPIYTGLLIYLTSLNVNIWVHHLFENKWVRQIGKISYSLYLWQQLFLVTQKSYNANIGLLQSLPVNIICAFLMAIFSYKFIERPLISFGRKFTGQII